MCVRSHIYHTCSVVQSHTTCVALHFVCVCASVFCCCLCMKTLDVGTYSLRLRAADMHSFLRHATFRSCLHFCLSLSIHAFIYDSMALVYVCVYLWWWYWMWFGTQTKKEKCVCMCGNSDSNGKWEKNRLTRTYKSESHFDKIYKWRKKKRHKGICGQTSSIHV